MNEHKNITQTEICDEENFNTWNLISALYIKYNNFKYIKELIQERKIRNKIKHNKSDQRSIQLDRSFSIVLTKYREYCSHAVIVLELHQA